MERCKRILIKDGRQQDNRAGVLHFKPDRNANLDLLGVFESDVQFLWRHPFKKYPVIQGAAHDLKRFSLFDCVATNQNYNSSEPAELATVQIDFIEGWVGQETYSAKDEIQFLNFMAGMHGLASWHNANVFPFIDATAKDSLIKYVKDRRVAFSHANPDSFQDNIPLYINVTIWMRMFLMAMVLKYCGVPANVLYAALSKNNEYGHIAKHMPLLLQSESQQS